MTFWQSISPFLCAALLWSAWRSIAAVAMKDAPSRSPAPLAIGAASFALAPLCTIELAVVAGPGAAPSGSALLHSLGAALLLGGGLLTAFVAARYRMAAVAAVVIGLTNAFFLTAGYGLIAASNGYGEAWARALPAIVIAAAPAGVFLSASVFSSGTQRLSFLKPVAAGAAFGAMILAGAMFAEIGAAGASAPGAIAHGAIWAGLAGAVIFAPFFSPRAKPSADQEKTEGPAQLLAQLPAGLVAVVLDPENRILDATPAARDLFPRREIDGGPAPFVAFVPADVNGTADKDEPLWAFVDRAGVKHYARMRASQIGADGADEMRLTVIELADSEVELRRAQESLQSRVRASFDESEDVCVFVSERGIVSEINRPALNFVRKSRNECVGDYVWNLFPTREGGAPHDTWLALLGSALIDGAATTEATLQGAEQDRLFRFRIARLGATGETGQLLASGRDITDITRMRRSFQEAQTRLEQTICERTAELTAAKKTADNANLSKSRFLANMSHELRTPLNAILGYTDLMMQDHQDEGTVDTQTYGDLERVKVNAAHLLTLINDVLDLAKVEANKMEISYSRVVLREFLLEVKASVDPLIAKRANRFIIRCERGLDQVAIDRKKVTQCLLNLLSNAAKFTDAGQITLTITSSQGDAGRMISFEVKDTGSGMTDEQCVSVFEEFTQVDNEYQATAGGTGLGLPIARRFAQLMGGDITARSKPGAGSAFTLTVKDGSHGAGAGEAAA